jgi:hypothetical protein
MKPFRFLLVPLLALATSGCISRSLAQHQPSMPVQEILRAGAIPALQVAPFALAPGKPPALDKSVTIRSVVLSSPDNGSFATYLQKTLETELATAGKLDPKSQFVVQGLLTDSQMDAGIGTGMASLGATFSLSKDGAVVFHKDLNVQAQWDSSFLGAVAIPNAINQYNALFTGLVTKLLQDDDFKASTQAH